MREVDLFGIPFESCVVNVSSVPQRSPFRYPGGKTWLIPVIRRWLRGVDANEKELVEPFVGGGIVSLTAVCEGLVKHATMVEKDEDVSAVWSAILGNDGKWLADELVKFDITNETVAEVLGRKNRSIRKRAFATLLKNRVNHGGILANGAGLLKHGENGKGILSRWYPQTLQKRIMEIVRFKDKLTFVEGDGMKVLAKWAARKDTVHFIDPPYTIAGRRLYTYPHIDHERLFDLASHLSGQFLMTYDNADEIRRLAEKNRFKVSEVPMMNTHHATKTELLISRNLDWL
jgi:DNA adenine methylase